MKVGMLLASIEDGGLENHTIELCNELNKKGIETILIANKKYKNLVKKFIEFDFSKSRNNPFMLYKLTKLLKKENFDIIHSQANKATSILAKIKPFLNSKIVATLHNYKTNLKAYEKMDFVITVSDSIAKNLKIKHKTIYNGIKLEDVNLIDLKKKFNIKKEFIITSAARFVKVKNLDLLLKGIAGIDDVHLILVGDGKEKKHLENLAKRLNIDVTFTGFLDATSTREIIKSSHLFVMTSKREGFPYTFVESMHLNTPFISTDISDIKKFISQKFIFQDETELKEKIVFIKNNYDNILKEFDEIFKITKKEFSLENMVKRTIEVYEKF